MNKPEFPDRSHIGRQNIINADLTRKNVNGPEFGWSYKLKKKIERFQIRYRDNQAFRDLVDGTLLTVLACAAFVAIFTVSLYLMD